MAWFCKIYHKTILSPALRISNIVAKAHKERTAAIVPFLVEMLTCLCVLIRPPDIVVGGHILPRILLFSPSNLRARWTELNHCSATWPKVSAIWKRMSKICGIPSPTNRGPKNHLFRRFRNLTANLTAYIFATKQHIDNRVSALQTARSLLYRLKMKRTLVHKRFKVGPAFSPTFRQIIMRLSSLPGFAHALQTTKLNQTLPHGRE